MEDAHSCTHRHNCSGLFAPGLRGVEQDVGLTADERFISCFDPSDWKYLQEESTKNSDTKSNEDAVSKGKRGKAFRKEAKAFVKRIKSDARKIQGWRQEDRF